MTVTNQREEKPDTYSNPITKIRSPYHDNTSDGVVISFACAVTAFFNFLLQPYTPYHAHLLSCFFCPQSSYADLSG